MISPKEFILPAGDYWIGDPFIVIKDPVLFSQMLKTSDYFKTGKATVELIKCWAGYSCTNGTFTDDDDNVYKCVSGMLGIIPTGNIITLISGEEDLQEAINELSVVGTFHTFDDDFTVYFANTPDRSIQHSHIFGNIRINTSGANSELFLGLGNDIPAIENDDYEFIDIDDDPNARIAEAVKRLKQQK